MTAAQTPSTPVEVAALAGRYGLAVDPDQVHLNEIGLDFRVAMARTRTGEKWVLRIPRRSGMEEQVAHEKSVLDLVRGHLAIEVPDWRIVESDLIAYPQLAGRPAMTLSDAGEPIFAYDVASPRYAVEFGHLIAALHAIGADEAAAAGLPTPTMAEIRAERQSELARVTEAFTVAPALQERWETWLTDDRYWPPLAAFGHGELYPGHVLIDDQDSITGALDWTTGGFSDPVRDLAFQQMIAPPEIFQLTVDSYAEAGGTVWPRLADHATELLSFGAVGHGLYALETGADDHRAAAQAGLDPAPLN
ncbi:macrolide 2'-phosphotransferase [Propionibacteriaceae bacterium Y1685]